MATGCVSVRVIAHLLQTPCTVKRTFMLNMQKDLWQVRSQQTNTNIVHNYTTLNTNINICIWKCICPCAGFMLVTMLPKFRYHLPTQRSLFFSSSVLISPLSLKWNLPFLSDCRGKKLQLCLFACVDHIFSVFSSFYPFHCSSNKRCEWVY